jgi:peptide/nickel transport system substrate-binding protein
MSSLSSKAITRVQAAIVIVIIVAAVAAGAYFATPRGPSPTPATTQGTSSVSVPNPDTIVYDYIGQPDTVDPATDYSTSMVIDNVYEGLVWFQGGRTDRIVPWLAESYVISPDGLTYTFHLRSGITFSDGTPFDANAVYFSLMRAIIIDDPAGPAWSLQQVVRGAANYSKSYNNAGPSAPGGYGDKYTQAELKDFLNAKPIEVLDPKTVVIYLERPYAGFLAVMTFTVAFIVSPTAIKAHWTAPTDGTPYIEGITCGDYHGTYNPWPEVNMLGTGPYILESWDKASQTLTLVRNEHYWGGPFNRGLAPAKNVIIHGVNDANTRLLDIKGGQSDVIRVPESSPLIFDYVDKDTYLKTGKLVPLSPDIQVYPQCPPTTPVEGKCSWSMLETDYVGLNERILGMDGKAQAFQPFADIRIRKAFTLAFNRTSFIHDGLQGLGVAATQILPPGMPGYDPSIAETPYDPDTAKQLLIDAGTHPITPDNAFSPDNTKTVQLTYDLGDIPHETAMVLLANSINNLAPDTGLYAEVVGMTFDQLLVAAHKGQLVYVMGWTVDYDDPDDFLVVFAHGTAGVLAHRVSYNNPNVTSLVDEQGSMQDQAQRLQVISQIERKVNNDYAYLWLYYPSEVSVSRTWLHERANESFASHISSFNPVDLDPYFYEIEKGGQVSSPSLSAGSSFLAEMQLPAISSCILKKSF